MLIVDDRLYFFSSKRLWRKTKTSIGVPFWVNVFSESSIKSIISKGTKSFIFDNLEEIEYFSVLIDDIMDASVNIFDVSLLDSVLLKDEDLIRKEYTVGIWRRKR